MSQKVPLWMCLIIAFLVGVVGFFSGFATGGNHGGFFADLFATESRAKIKNPKRIDRLGYSVDYPSNWTIDRSDPEFDLDHYLMLESPGGSYVWFMFSGAEDPEEAAATQVESYSEGMRAMKVDDFSEYGNLEGIGKRVSGRYFAFRVEVNIFCALQGETAVTIIEFAYLEDLPLAKPGFELVRDSFLMKPDPTP